MLWRAPTQYISKSQVQARLLPPQPDWDAGGMWQQGPHRESPAEVNSGIRGQADLKKMCLLVCVPILCLCQAIFMQLCATIL